MTHRFAITKTCVTGNERIATDRWSAVRGMFDELVSFGASESEERVFRNRWQASPETERGNMNGSYYEPDIPMTLLPLDKALGTSQIVTHNPVSDTKIV